MDDSLKAYVAFDSERPENYQTIVFAENRGKAKAQAMHSDACEDAEYINISVRRDASCDKLYKGKREIDWYDDETRIELVKNHGWQCGETPSPIECEKCPAKQYCSNFEYEQEGDF